MGLDAESDQRAEGYAEGAGKDDVNGTGAHGECSGLDVAKVISVDADSAKECRQSAHMDAPVVRAVCTRVDRARLALRAIEEVVREDARVEHGKGSNDGRGSLPAGLTLDLAVVDKGAVHAGELVHRISIVDCLLNLALRAGRA